MNGWPKCPGMKGGSDTEVGVTPHEKPTAEKKCEDCGESFKQIGAKNRHQKFRCPKAKNVDHLELTRRSRGGKGKIQLDPNDEEKNSTTYVVDREMEKYVSTTLNFYAMYRMSENPKNPIPIPGFWPALFDYRGINSLSDVEKSVDAKTGFKTLASILSDAYQYHGIESITYTKTAFVETEDGKHFQISNYRVPKSHCVINDGVTVRIDQPRFCVTETKFNVTVSFHKKYLQLLPKPLMINSEKLDEENNIEPTQVETELNEEEMEKLFDEEKKTENSYTDESFSQEFSQVSLQDSQELVESPAQKKLDLILQIKLAVQIKIMMLILKIDALTAMYMWLETRDQLTATFIITALKHQGWMRWSLTEEQKGH